MYIFVYAYDIGVRESKIFFKRKRLDMLVQASTILYFCNQKRPQKKTSEIIQNVLLTTAIGPKIILNTLLHIFLCSEVSIHNVLCQSLLFGQASSSPIMYIPCCPSGKTESKKMCQYYIAEINFSTFLFSKAETHQCWCLAVSIR